MKDCHEHHYQASIGQTSAILARIVFLWLLLSACSLDLSPEKTSSQPPTADIGAATVTGSVTPAQGNRMVTTPIQQATSTVTETAANKPFLNLEQRWRFTTGGRVTDLDFISLDGGPWPDIVASSTDKQVYALAEDQTAYWQAALEGAIYALTAADLDGDNIGDVIVGGLDNQVTVIESGNVRWQVPTPGHVTDLLVTDINEIRLVVATGNGWLLTLDPEGTLLWERKLADAGISKLDEADMAGDSAPEIIAAIESGQIVVINAAGELVWGKDMDIPIFDVAGPQDGGGHVRLVVGTSGGEILGLNGQGKEQWLWQGDGRVSALVAEDLDEDGRVEVVAGTQQTPGQLYILDLESGQLIGQSRIENSVSALEVGDVDGDGQKELILGTVSGLVSILDGNARELGRYQLNDPVNGILLENLNRSNTSPLKEIVVWAGSTITLFEIDNLEPVSTQSPAPVVTVPPLATRDQAVLYSRPHYALDVKLDYSSHQVQVEEQVTISNNTPDNWSDIVFHVSAAYWPNIFSLSTAQVTLDEVTQSVEPTLDSTLLRVGLPRPLVPAEDVVVGLSYRLLLPRLDPVGWGPTGNAGWGPTVIQMGDWYPALVPYGGNGQWTTWQYLPIGDPVISVLGDYDVTIKAPSEVKIAAAGWIETVEGLHHYRLENARAFAFLASTDFIRLDSSSNDVPIKVYVRPVHEQSGQVVLETVRQAINLFSELYGPYPYPEFVMAENGFLTAMEYSQMVSLSGFAFDTYEGEPDSLLVAITAHEVAHQWWYGAVGNDQVYEPWLDESLCMLSELLFYQWFYPELVDWWWQFRVDRWEPTGTVDVTIYDYPDSPTFVHNMYGTAAHFIDDLRETMGESAFMSFLTDYYAQNAFTFTTTEAFFEAVGRHTEADLTPLINQYFQNDPRP